MDLRDGVETLGMGGRTSRRPLPGLCDEERRRVYFYVLMPNLLLSLHPDYMLTHRLRPPRLRPDRDPLRLLVPHPDELARPGFNLDDAVAFWDLTNRQDWHVSELTQLGIGSRGYEPGPYSDREDLLLALDRIVPRLRSKSGANPAPPGYG